MREAAIVRFVKGLVNSWDAIRSSCLARLVIGLMRGGRLGVAAIGRHVRTKTTDKHHIKSVDRFLGNQALDLSVLWRSLAALASSQRPRLFVLLDWTDLHHDKLEALVAAVSYGGRALPIAWATTRKGIYERSRNLFETNFCRLLKTLVPDTVELVIVADRGFGRASLFAPCERPGSTSSSASAKTSTLSTSGATDHFGIDASREARRVISQTLSTAMMLVPLSVPSSPLASQLAASSPNNPGTWRPTFLLTSWQLAQSSPPTSCACASSTTSATTRACATASNFVAFASPPWSATTGSSRLPPWLC